MSQADDVQEKQSWEEIPHTVNFEDSLPSGDTIASATVTVTDKDGTDVSSSMRTSPSKTDTTVSTKLMAGTSGQYYNVSTRATTAAGYKLEHDLLLYVKDRTAA